MTTTSAQTTGQTHNPIFEPRNLATHHAHIRGHRGLPKAIGVTRHDLLIVYWHVVHPNVDYADLAQTGTTAPLY